MKIRNWLAAAAFSMLASTANAASTVFSATDGDVNFLFAPLGSYILGMFDEADFGGTALEVPVPSIVGIAGPVNLAGDYIATNIYAETISLYDDDNFVLGISLDGINWIMDSGATYLGANTYEVTFMTDAISGSFLTVDVAVVPAIPVPAAVWLFGSGLVGLVGIARRRTIV